MKRARLILAGGVAFVAAPCLLIANTGSAKSPSAANVVADASEGATLYRAKCGGCHAVDANRVGPAHRNVVGSRIASAPGYSYSPALTHVRGIWTRAQLDRWLQNPQKFAPGSRMFLVVDDVHQRHAIIAYLASVSPSPRR